MECFTCKTPVDAYSSYCEECITAQIKAQGGTDWQVFAAYQRFAHAVARP